MSHRLAWIKSKTVMGRFAALNPHRDVFLQLLDLREVIEVETSASGPPNSTIRP